MGPELKQILSLFWRRLNNVVKPCKNFHEFSLNILRPYFQKRLLFVLILGFVSGLPLLLSFGTLSAWLREAEIDRSTIGLFSLVGLPYALKPLWAPLMDGARIPFLTNVL